MRHRRLLVVHPQHHLSLPQSNVLQPQQRNSDQDFYYYPYENKTTQHNRGILYWLRCAIVLTLQGIVLWSLSLLSFVFFYQYHQPQELFRRDLHFDYFPLVAKETSPRRSLGAALSRLLNGKPKKLAMIPVAHSDFFELCVGDNFESNITSDLTVSSSTPSSSCRASHKNSGQKRYFVEIMLQLPESPANLQAGMWSLHLELVGGATTRRSLRFPYRSAWVRVIRNLVVFVPLLIHALDESQWLSVPILRHQEFTDRVTRARVACGAPEITAAYMIVGEEWGAVYTILRNWFWTSAITGTTLFAIFYCIVWQIVYFSCFRARVEPARQPYSHEPSFYAEDIYDNFNVGEHEGIHDAGSDDFLDAQMDDNRAEEVPIQSSEPIHHVDDQRPPPGFEDHDSDDWEDLSFGEDVVLT